MSLIHYRGPFLWASVAATLVVASPSFVPSGPPPVPDDGAQASAPRVTAASDVEAGRYLVKVAGCNDCHTPGFMQHGMQVPEAVWLTGTSIGWRGPWGTTYPTNLRRFVQETPEDVWMTIGRERTTRPPMPWDNLHSMSDADLMAIYRYIRHLGPAGEPAPAYCEPGVEPETACFLLDPEELGFRRVYAAAPALDHCRAAGVEGFELMGFSVRVLVPSGATRDACSLLELTLPAGAGAPPHRLKHHDKVLHVVAGEVEVRLGADVFRAGAGDRVVVPRAATHALRNVGDAAARVQVLTSPGGHDEFISETAALGSDASPAELAELRARYGVELIGS